MKIAEALLLRKQLEAKVKQLEPLKINGENGVFETKVQRVKISDEVEEARLQIPKISLREITKTYDHYASELRKVDAAIQKANWQYKVDFTETQLPKEESAKSE